MMDTPPNTLTPTIRRTTRSALAEIPARLGGLTVAENAGVPNQTIVAETPGINGGGILNITNRSTTSVSPAPSPEEMLIQQRGRRRLPVTWSPDIDANKRQGPVCKDRTPVKTSLKESPMKSTIVLRSTPRKRLLLNDPKEFCLTSPEKHSKKSSPLKKMRIERSSTMYCFLPTSPSTNGTSTNNTVTSASTPLQSALKGLSQEQLTKVIETLLSKHPQLESEIIETLPAPDITPLEERLCYLKKNIFKSLPNSRLTSKTDSPAYSRAATHVVAFKKCVVEQGRMLMDSQHWGSVLEYVLLAWTYVKATPLWDNPPHNAARKQCFKSLAAMAINSIKKGIWSNEQIEDIHTRFASCDPESEDMQACVKQISQLRRK